MKIWAYLRNNGIRHAMKVLWVYKIDILLQKCLGLFLKHKSLQDIIVIESHNDFDCNGGAFYSYLIKNGYNQKYKIVWLIKHPENVPKNLPENVECVNEYKPDIKKDYYRWVAKWFLCDQDCAAKLREDQISMYLTHGPVGLKDVTGVISLPENLTYCLAPSDFYAPITAKHAGMSYPNSKLKICGYPSYDVFYEDGKGDLCKVTDKKYNKVILWMPTFRKSEGGRCDSISVPQLGVPLLKDEEEYQELNGYLKKLDILLVIKIHPKQDISDMKIRDETNIKVLTGKDVKRLDIDNFRLMKDVDALISDYSSVAYDFLHVDEPIAYDFSDLDNYTRGIVVDDPHEMMAGHEIKNLFDLFGFVEDVSNNRDPYKTERKVLFDKIFKYHDGNSSARIAELLNLKGR